MPFSSNANSGPSGYKIFARGIVPAGGGTIGNPLNVESVSGVQANGYCYVNTLTAIPANAIATCRALHYSFMPGGVRILASQIETQMFYIETAPFSKVNCTFSFEIWVPE